MTVVWLVTALVAVATPAGAQESTTTTVPAAPTTLAGPDGNSTTTTTAPAPTTTAPPVTISLPPTTSTTSTTAPPGGVTPPPEGNQDATSEEAPPPVGPIPAPAGSIPAPPEPSPAVLAALRRQTDAARADLAAAIARRDEATMVVRAVESAITDLEGELRGLRAEARQAVRRLERARDRMERQAVAAYTGGRLESLALMVDSEDINDLARRRELVDASLRAGQRTVVEYRDARADAGSSVSRRVVELAKARSDLRLALDEERARAKGVADAQATVDAVAAGSLVAVRSFVFPVAGRRRFSNDFGFPRMPGTAFSHSHQGTDIFAAFGTPLVACERGVVIRIGHASLGGAKFWLVGESGIRYYYAHLSAFAPGLVEGLVVEPGQVLGYVGDSGNARGTPPHLHFEIHPPGSPAVNPFPLLQAVDKAAPWAPPATTTAGPPASASP